MLLCGLLYGLMYDTQEYVDMATSPSSFDSMLTMAGYFDIWRPAESNEVGVV